MLTPEQIALLIELMEEVEKAGFKSEALVALSKSHLFTDTLVDLKQMNYEHRSDEEPE
jgi:hypothetical protein